MRFQSPCGEFGFCESKNQVDHASEQCVSVPLRGVWVLRVSVIAERWEEFFENPGKFLKEHWPNWAKAVQAPELKYQIEFLDR